MSDFDPRTAFLIVALLYVVLPGFAWIVLAGRKSPSIALWCGGGLLLGAGVFSFVARGATPAWMSFEGTNLLCFVSGVLRIQALRLDLGTPWRRATMVAAPLGFIALYHGARNIDLAYAQGLSLIALIGVTIQIAWFARNIQRNESSRSAGWIAGAYATLSAALITALVFRTAGWADTDVFAHRFDTLFLAVALILASVIGHLGYIGLALDRAARRNVAAAETRVRDEENRRTVQQLAHLDRQRSLGEMAASLGHELNQPLTAILTNAQVAMRIARGDGGQHEQLPGLLENVAFNARRATQIVERIRGFIRPAAISRVPVDLARIARESAELVAHEAARRDVRILFEPSEAPLVVSGDAILLSQVLVNLYRNAVDAMAEAPEREIVVASHVADGRAVLTVSDSGPGFDDGALEKAGSPFFTTKSEGLGMGLSISRSILRQHDGRLVLGNAEGGGARIEIDLPLVQGAA